MHSHYPRGQARLSLGPQACPLPPWHTAVLETADAPPHCHPLTAVRCSISALIAEAAGGIVPMANESSRHRTVASLMMESRDSRERDSLGGSVLQLISTLLFSPRT